MNDARTQTLLQSIMGAKIYHDTHNDEAAPAVPLVTVSRGLGANGHKIAARLAESLQVPLYDKELITEVTKQAKSDPYLTKRLDERTSGVMAEWVTSMFTGKSTSKDTFNYYMVKVIMSIAPQGGVIVGRGAHLLLSQKHKVFRLRVEGSLHHCAERVAKRENIKQKKAEKLVVQTDRERQEFVENLYQNHSGRHNYYDMVVNTDLFKAQATVELVEKGMREMGFIMPK
ncbi:cytidylate kinase-like family protein [Magnetococcus sp. PR-3]|uniref:cytidylate kinase-like family protein n=1 Tax=Magnetococcus sp. PR-3 TaxID=3120355 RepID=UPI002FCE12DE